MMEVSLAVIKHTQYTTLITTPRYSYSRLTVAEQRQSDVPLETIINVAHPGAIYISNCGAHNAINLVGK